MQATLTANQAERQIRQVEILSVARMSAITSVSEELFRAWIKLGELKPEVHASSRMVQAGGQVEENIAAVKNHQNFAPRWREMSAEECFRNFWESPKGRQRLLGPAHMRDTQARMKGYEPGYFGPLQTEGAFAKPVVTDEQMTDVQHKVDKGQSIRDATLEVTAPKVAEAMQTEPKKRGPGRPRKNPTP